MGDGRFFAGACVCSPPVGCAIGRNLRVDWKPRSRIDVFLKMVVLQNMLARYSGQLETCTGRAISPDLPTAHDSRLASLSHAAEQSTAVEAAYAKTHTAPPDRHPRVSSLRLLDASERRDAAE